MPEMQFDFDGLIQLLAGHLYSEKKVFIRELVQNAHDAIQRRAHADPDFSASGSGRIDIVPSLAEEPGHVIFRDNGVGMSKKDLEEYLSSIGTSGTRRARDEEEVPDVIGQFGIGFLAGFVVASRIEVRTRHFKEKNPIKGWLWKNEGKKEYTLEACEVANPGTEIRVFLKDVTDRGLLQNDAIREVIRFYADMLKVPIHLNRSEAPENTRIMPWEREFNSERERDLDYYVYLERTVPDSVLEVIPVRIDEPAPEGRIRAEGLLYVTRTRRVAGDTPRTIRLFQKRMFVCENEQGIFPRWAVFINGILNTPDLRPNAARDNFVRDENYGLLREKLGTAVIAHFEKLRETDPDRLSQILAYHDLAIKSACDINKDFFKKFGGLLEWRVNGKSPAAKAYPERTRGRRGMPAMDGTLDYAWVTLPDVIAALPQPEDGATKRLTCFTTRSSANQFFEMADAAGTTVLDASYPFESGLLKEWIRENPGITLSYIDREDDPSVFKDIDLGTDSAVQEMANEMTLSLRTQGGVPVQVEARRFEPKSLTAVIKSNEASSGREKAESILNDPNAASDLRAMAEDMIRMSHNAARRMSINAANPLIQRVAELLREVGRDNSDVVELMLGIYNDAILYNQELMTPDNAKIFHQQFGRLMSRNAELISQSKNIELRMRQVEEAEARHRGTQGEKRKHLVAFLMTPFASEFDSTREGIRIAIEDHYGCKLSTADKETFDRFIHGNVSAHLNDADFFLADLTGTSPNVMLELGAVLFQHPRPPFIPIQRVAGKDDKPELPVDIGNAIVMRYTPEMTPKEVAQQLIEEIEKDRALRPILEDDQRERILSAAVLRRHARVPLVEGIYETLTKSFPSVSSWSTASEQEVAQYLGADADMASIIRKRILEGLR